jgi:hypothetical protein
LVLVVHGVVGFGVVEVCTGVVEVVQGVVVE